jgi:dipeptidyl aminopeptidase/acylaminoacyl peptidase
VRKLQLLIAGLGVALAGCAVDSGEAASAQAARVSASPVAAHLQLRRVWAGTAPNFYASNPSPDGRYLTEIDWSTGDLAVLDLASGELRRVTNKGTWTDNTDYAEFSVFSPDGERLAYSWFSERGRGYELRVIGLDGQGMRVLVPANPELQYVAAEDWSPDGRLILTTNFRADRSSQIATVSTADGSMRVLKTSDWRHPFVAAFSPDSRYIAYDFPPDEKDSQRDIFLMPVDGGRETRLVGGPAHDVLLGWLGEAILFYSDRHQTKGIWRQAVRDGRPVGEPELLRPDVWRLFPIGFSREAYYFGVSVELPQVHTATLDLANDRVVAPPAAVQEAGSGQSTYGAWSADSRYLAYLSSQTGERATFLTIRPVDGADQRRIALELTQTSNLQWSSDGAAVLLFGTDRNGREGVHRVDLRSGALELVLQKMERADDLRRFRLTPDGRQLIFKRGREDATETGMRRPLVVVAHDLETASERVFYTHDPVHLSLGPVEISPDGRYFSSKARDIDARKDRLVVGHTDGSGQLRVIHETSGRFLQNRGGFPWTPDSRHVLAIEHLLEEGMSRLLKIPVAGGEPRVLLELDSEVAGIQLEQRFTDLRLSPDGRRISFGSGMDRGEIWRIDNLSDLAEPAALQVGSR